MSFQNASSAPADHPAPVPGELFWPALLRGLLTAAFGIALLIWPHLSVHLLGLLAGLWLLLVGLAQVFASFVPLRGLGGQVLSGVVGILLVVAGIACLRDVTKGVLVLAFLIALAWIFIGLAQLVAAAQTVGAARTWLIVLGVAAVVVGFAFLLWPAPSLTVVVILAGISGLAVGLAEIALALRLRKLAREPAPGLSADGPGS
jgi:uncharacterized membrane protein HdeD (DUF308 family)